MLAFQIIAAGKNFQQNNFWSQICFQYINLAKFGMLRFPKNFFAKSLPKEVDKVDPTLSHVAKRIVSQRKTIEPISH